MLLSLSAVRSQHYEADYLRGNSDKSASELSGYNEEPGDSDRQPDYTKFFAGGSAPFLTGASEDAPASPKGFVTPLNFGELFGGSSFGKIQQMKALYNINLVCF